MKHKIGGGAILEWEFDDAHRHERGPLWYGAMITVGLGLLLYAVISGNFLFALIVILFAVVVGISVATGPTLTRFAVSEDGVLVGDAFYSYREFERFWFIYQPPEVRHLHLEFKSALKMKLIIELEGQDPNEVRAIIGKYVREDLTEDEENIGDYLARMLKL